MINKKNSKRIFDISYICRNKLLINGKKKRERKHEKKLKNRRANSLSELTKKFIQILLEEKKDIINLKEIIPKIKVKKRRIYDITNVFQATNLIKKRAKNKIELLNNFHNMYPSEDSCIIDLKENDNNNEQNFMELSNKKKLNIILEESKKVDNLIKILDDKLSDQNEEKNEKENEYDNISLAQSDLISLIPDMNKYTNLLIIKSESGIKVENSVDNEARNKEQKKCETYNGRLNGENMDFSSYSNKSWIISNNNTSLNIINIDLKKEDHGEKDNLPSNNNYGESKLEDDRVNYLFSGERNNSIISCNYSMDNISNYSL